jgi:uncharacterized membrane protein
MIRALLWILGAILLGGIVHLSTVLVMPQAATQDAYARLLPITPVNAMVPLTVPTAENSIMPLMDPAFAAAVCRYDLSAGAIKLNAPLSQAYTSVTFYTRNSVAYYAIDDRAAGRRAIELDLMTPEQHAQVPEGEDVTAADRLIIESPTKTGLIVLRALAPEPGLMAMARRCNNYFSATTAGAASAAKRGNGTIWLPAICCCNSVKIRSASAATGIGSATVRCSSAKR